MTARAIGHRCAGFLLGRTNTALAGKNAKTRLRQRTGKKLADAADNTISSRRFHPFEARPLLHSPHFLLYD